MLGYAFILFATIPILYRVPKVQYYVKFSVFFLLIFIGSFICSIRLAFKGRRYENISSIFWKDGWFKSCCRGRPSSVRGTMYLRLESSKLHRYRRYSSIQVLTSCDNLGVGDIWPKRCSVVSKASLKFMGFLGMVMWLSKTICIDRSHHTDAISAMEKAAIEAKQDKVNALHFDCLTRFREHFTWQSSFPIQPIVVEPYAKFLDHKKKLFKSGEFIFRNKLTSEAVIYGRPLGNSKVTL
ncbi:unnamed protein product [Schistosoma margrebowiei]|uniref:Phospholipid/glycerol acyltransferase domain-containing protein n=1 Tax=Schistosoma margrebowiei TaxID=48269 RepID=A0A183LBS8_9TREM|nr:unnamed protein product [Schistosoma margrebowiei]